MHMHAASTRTGWGHARSREIARDHLDAEDVADDRIRRERVREVMLRRGERGRARPAVHALEIGAEGCERGVALEGMERVGVGHGLDEPGAWAGREDVVRLQPKRRGERGREEPNELHDEDLLPHVVICL